MIYVRKDEIEYLNKMGLGKYVIAKTCHGKKFAEEDRKVLVALKKYNSSLITEGNNGAC